MSDYLERGPTDCWFWQKSPKDAPNIKAKMACNNPMCCNPRHIVSTVNDDDVIEELRGTASQMGLKVDKRWGSQRLIDEIQKAE